MGSKWLGMSMNEAIFGLFPFSWVLPRDFGFIKAEESRKVLMNPLESEIGLRIGSNWASIGQQMTKNEHRIGSKWPRMGMN